MTSTTKQYIDLDDLAAFVATCTLCQASLSLRLDADRMQLPQSCPSCQGTWYVMGGASIGSDLSMLRDIVKQLKENLRRENRHVTIQIEINSVSPAAVASSKIQP